MSAGAFPRGRVGVRSLWFSQAMFKPLPIGRLVLGYKLTFADWKNVGGTVLLDP